MTTPNEQVATSVDAGTASGLVDVAPPAAAPPATALPATAPLVDRSVIHDLRNPLSAIAGNLQLLQASLEANLDPKNRARLVACLNSVDELTGMLTDLQYLTLLHTGSLELACKPADMRALAKGMLQSLANKPVLDGKTITLVDGPAPCIPVMSQLVVRAMQNVVVAALRMAKSSPLTLELLDLPGEHVQVIVTYAGVAVPAPLSQHLFDLDCPYTQQQHGFRVDRCRGLYFVRATARLHGGQTLYVPTDAGGRFLLTLPYQPSPLPIT